MDDIPEEFIRLNTFQKRLTAIILIVILGAGLSVGIFFYKRGPAKLTSEYYAMDTVMSITLISTRDTDADLEVVDKQIMDRIYEVEKEMSVTMDGSDVDRLNFSSGEPVAVSRDTYRLLQRALEIAEDTDGCFEPTIYPIVLLWGFTTGDYEVPDEASIKKELKNVGYKRIHLLSGNIDSSGKIGATDTDDFVYVVRVDPGTKVDLGAIAKGFLSDELCDIMRSHHVNGIVSLGGNVQSVGTKEDGESFTVGITDPADPEKIYKRISSSDEAVVTSGNYERYFEQDGKIYHHIMDRRTGAPAENELASVTVRGPKGVYCDAYATALYVMGADAAKAFAGKHPDYKVSLIYKDGTGYGFE
ncbi:MAG TPA: FAD:protein FMN transferase [Lachnospiraceae bacterium]|nr:FAD:protein FMN transferase [Lachnospiraceae bacterium]